MTTQNLTEIRLKTTETSFTMRGRSEHDPRMVRKWTRQSATRRATRGYLSRSPRSFCIEKNISRSGYLFQISPNIAPGHEKSHLNFTKHCACHEKWHFNFTKCCACHKKWHLTKYCACHEKWLFNFTKCSARHKKCYLNLTKYCASHEKCYLNLTKYSACHKKCCLNLTKYCASHEKWHLRLHQVPAPCHEMWPFNITK